MEMLRLTRGQCAHITVNTSLLLPASGEGAACWEGFELIFDFPAQWHLGCCSRRPNPVFSFKDQPEHATSPGSLDLEGPAWMLRSWLPGEPQLVGRGWPETRDDTELPASRAA